MHLTVINFQKLYLVQIQTTSACNASCVFCPYKDSWYKKNPGKMSDSLYLKILNDINSYDPDFNGKFCPYLMNEPFTDKKIIDKMQKAYDMLNNPFVALSTNAELLTDGKIDDLYEMFKINNFNGKIGFTHYGTSMSSLEATMDINYEIALTNIIKTIEKFNGDMKISISTNTYSNDDSQRVRNQRDVLRYWHKIFKSHNLKKTNIKILPKVFHNRAGNVENDNWDYDRIVRKIDKDHPFDCKRLDALHVNYKGIVVGCCMDYHREEDLGDLTNQSVSDYFNSNKYRNWADRVMGYRESDDDFICKRCTSPGG